MNNKKLKIAVLFAGSAGPVPYLMNDPNYGQNHEFVCAFTNTQETSGSEFFKSKGIPCEMFNTKDFCVAHDYNGKLSEMPSWIRRKYFTALKSRIHAVVGEIDLVLLSGFMMEITSPLLGYKPIINAYPADLRIVETIKFVKGEYNALAGNTVPKYIGGNAVALAIRNGEKEIRSTVHVVEERINQGRIICVSDPLFIEPGVGLEEYQKNMEIYNGQAYQKALEMIFSEEFKF